MLLLPYCSPVDNRVPVDKIDHYDYHYHDSTDSKMWQGSLPHKKFFGKTSRKPTVRLRRGLTPRSVDSKSEDATF